MLRNILGPVFNFNLDQFLTLDLFLFVFWGGGWNPYFYSVFSKYIQNWKKHKKEKKTLFVNTLVLIVIVESVRFFFLHFSFLLFLEFPCFSEMFLIGFQKSKNNKIWKQQKQKQQQQHQKNKMQCKNNSKIMFQKTRTTSRKQNKKQKNELERKKQTKQKWKGNNQTTEMRNRKEEEKRTRERP